MLTVTRILSVFTDFSSVPAEKLEYAANRGTEVHSVCEAHANGIWIPDMTEDARGYYNSFLKWWPMVREVLFTEKELVSGEHGFMGHVDLGCVLTDGRRVIVDYKTPLQKSPTWRGQCAAYKHLANENGWEIDQTGSLRLDPFGGVPKMDWYNEDGRDWFAFLSGLYALRYFRKED